MKRYHADMQTAFDPTGAQPSRFQFYFGPNHFKTLLASNKLSFEDKDQELEDLVYLGWPIIRLINRWFTINLFDWLSNMGLSMGIVILLMTIIVKILVLPATWKSFISSAKMRALKPYVDKINEKYPKQEDALKKQQETMSLYSQYGVSPMGGCLPALIQAPVFMALFFFVPNAIELRQQSFLWADDLSAYDDLIHWSTSIPLLGNHLSLFEMDDVHHACDVLLHLQRIRFGTELLLLHLRSDRHPHPVDYAPHDRRKEVVSTIRSQQESPVFA